MSAAQTGNFWGWAALLGTPSLALLNLSASYALVTPACAHQQPGVMHGLSLVCIVLSALLTLHSARTAGSNFVSLIGALTGTLLTLVIVTQWIPVWMLSPCD
jgi:hypothetical protein